MLYKLEEDALEVNTSESYNKEIYLFNNHLIIPYINLEIFENKTSLKEIKQYDKLDFSYLIFRNVEEVSWGSEYQDENRFKQLKFNHISSDDKEGFIEDILVANIFNEYDGFEFKIKYEEQYLCYSGINVNVKNGALDFWVPMDTPYFMKNIAEEKVLEFFNWEKIPAEIINFLEINDLSMIKVLNLLKAEG